MWSEFKAFILKGNVLELAVAVIVAGAFATIVASFTSDIIMPPLGMLLGGVDFSDLAMTLQAAEMNDAGEVVKEAVQIRYGAFIQTIINFLIIAFAIFMLLKAYKSTQEPEPAAAPAPDPGPSTEDLLAEIRDLLKKQQISHIMHEKPPGSNVFQEVFFFGTIFSFSAIDARKHKQGDQLIKLWCKAKQHCCH